MFDFGTLRSFLNQPPSAHRWAELCQRMEHTFRRHPDLTREVLIPYTMGYARDWPVEACKTPRRWRLGILREQYTTTGASPRDATLLPLVRELDLFRAGETRPEAIADTPNLHNLHTLKLYDVQWSPDGLRRALTSHHFTELRHLRIEHTNAPDAALLPIVQADWFGGLRKLELIRAHVEPEGFAALCARPMPHLDELWLDLASPQVLSADELGLFTRAPWLPQLKHLYVMGQTISDAHIAHLATLDLPNLEFIFLNFREAERAAPLAHLPIRFNRW